MYSSQKFLRPVEVMTELGISYANFLRRVKDKKIPAVKLGNRLMVPRSFIESLEDQAYDSIKEVADVSND